MRRFPEPIQNAVAALSRLPGVGPKTALRYVYYLLKLPKAEHAAMARAIVALGERIHVCEDCYMYAERTPCELCADGKRTGEAICVVEESRDIATIESTDAFRGRYHVLGGTLSPIDGITPDMLRVRELVSRVESDAGIEEIILALSPTVGGETTMMYLGKQLAPLGRRVTRLARGLPIGATVEYADEITLGDAIKGRKDA